MNFKISLFVILSFFSLSLFAQDVQVEFGFNIYSLKMTKDEVIFKKKDYEAIVKREECSKKLFNDFVERFSSITKETPKDQTTGSEFLVKYKVDQKEGILTPSHPYAQTLLSIPKNFDVFKLATEFRCQKDKK